MTAAYGVPQGSSKFFVTATSGSDTATLKIATAADFSVSLQSRAQGVLQARSSTYQVRVNSTGGFDGSLQLKVSGLPAGITGQFDTPVLDAPGTATLPLSADKSAAPGPLPLTLTGTNGSVSRTASLGVQLKNPDFQISAASAASAAKATKAGQISRQSIVVTPVSGFKVSINLVATGLPPGATASFDPPSVNGFGSSTLSIKTDARTAAGPSTIRVTGTSGSLTHFTIMTLSVGRPDFDLSVTPAAQVISPGSSTSYSVAINPQNGFASPVSLSVTGAPVGVTATFNPALINGAAPSSPTLSSTVLASPGSYLLTITATGGGISHAAPIAILITTDPGFVIIPASSFQAIFAGGRITNLISLSAVASSADSSLQTASRGPLSEHP